MKTGDFVRTFCSFLLISSLTLLVGCEEVTKGLTGDNNKRQASIPPIREPDPEPVAPTPQAERIEPKPTPAPAMPPKPVLPKVEFLSRSGVTYKKKEGRKERPYTTFSGVVKFAQLPLAEGTEVKVELVDRNQDRVDLELTMKEDGSASFEREFPDFTGAGMPVTFRIMGRLSSSGEWQQIGQEILLRELASR